MRDSVFELQAPREFSFRECIRYLSRSPEEVLYEVKDDSRIIRPLCTGDSVVLMEISSPDHGQRLRVKLLAGAGTTGAGSAGRPEADLDAVREAALNYIRDWFDLERSLAPFYRMAETDLLLGPLTKQFYGLRLIGIPDLFEALCWAIVGQQVHLAFAYKLKRKLTEAYGDAFEHQGRVYRLFPRPEQLCGAAPDELSRLQLTKAKAAAIVEVATLMQSGALSRSRLLSLGDFEEAERELVRIRGVGPWTAHYVRMRCLRDPRAFPVGDVGLQNAVKALLAMADKPTRPELEAMFARWKGWEAYATFYLWRTLY